MDKDYVTHKFSTLFLCIENFILYNKRHVMIEIYILNKTDLFQLSPTLNENIIKKNMKKKRKKEMNK